MCTCVHKMRVVFYYFPKMILGLSDFHNNCLALCMMTIITP